MLGGNTADFHCLAWKAVYCANCGEQKTDVGNNVFTDRIGYGGTTLSPHHLGLRQKSHGCEASLGCTKTPCLEIIKN